jgi:hypothetical protein
VSCGSVALINPNKFPTIIRSPHLRTFCVRVHEFNFAFIDHVIVNYKQEREKAGLQLPDSTLHELSRVLDGRQEIPCYGMSVFITVITKSRNWAMF